MFQGTIPQAARQILSEVAQGWRTDTAAIACSGNLTIERTLHEHQRFTLHSCDVSIYSCALGAYFARQPFRLSLKSTHVQEWHWLQPYLASQSDALATLMLLSNLQQGITSAGQIANNAYYRRLWAGYRQQWDDLHARTVKRIEEAPLRLASFHAGDAVDWLPTLPADTAVLSFPPFFAKGYAVMWAKLEVLFDWDAPAYQEIFEARRQQFLRDLMARDCWLIGTSYPIDDYAPYLRGRCQTTNRGVPLYLYASTGTARVVVPHQMTAPLPYQTIAPGDNIAAPLRLVQLTAPQFRALRSRYLNPTIKPADAALALGVFAGDKLIGAFAMNKSFQQPGAAADTLYLLSDFAVAPTDYPRLSKLILHAALSHEAKIYAERTAGRRVRHLFTTAFTNNPVSMKYRGLFELHSRKETPADPDHKFMLNYIALAGQWSLDEALSRWQKKHGAKHD